MNPTEIRWSDRSGEIALYSRHAKAERASGIWSGGSGRFFWGQNPPIFCRACGIPGSIPIVSMTRLLRTFLAAIMSRVFFLRPPVPAHRAADGGVARKRTRLVVLRAGPVEKLVQPLQSLDVEDILVEDPN